MPVVKVVELVGTSDQGWEAAVQDALDEAARTIQNIESIEIGSMTAAVEDGQIAEWQVDVRVAFRIEDRLREEHHAHHGAEQPSHI